MYWDVESTLLQSQKPSQMRCILLTWWHHFMRPCNCVFEFKLWWARTMKLFHNLFQFWFFSVDSFLFNQTLSNPDFDPHSDTYYTIFFWCKSKLDFNSLMPLKLATQGCICFYVCIYKNRLENQLKIIIFFLITDHLVIRKSLSGDVKNTLVHIIRKWFSYHLLSNLFL